MIHKYTDNIAYLFKKDTTDNDLEYETTGQIFQYDIVQKKRNSLDPITGIRMQSTDIVWRTDYQYEFTMHDKVAMTKIPTEDDFSIIINSQDKPIMQEGNKHRKAVYYDYDLTVS